jgi:aldose 1-epimerase
MQLLSLRAGRLALDLAPQAGGSIARFTLDDAIDLLRPLPPEGLAPDRGNRSACYPLVPFSNRIGHGRLAFGDQLIRLEPNWPGVSHPMHGEGWAGPWKVMRSDRQSTELLHEHDGKRGWPFRYRARQSFRLGGDTLTIMMSIENLERQAVPAGIGLHPFFARDDDTEICFRAAGVWLADADVLPTERIDVPPSWDFSTPRPVVTGLDNCFEGWDGNAAIIRPRHGVRLDVQASEPFRHAVVYTPPDRAYLCVEPVSHANGQVGQSRLAAGATLSGTIVFRLSSQ